MSFLSQWLPNLQPTAGAVMLWAAGVVAAVVVVVGIVAFRRPASVASEASAKSGAHSKFVAPGTLIRGAMVLVGAIALWALFDRLATQDQAAARRALDARAEDLTLRAIAPGSPLACLDAIGNATVEAACEVALFASPETTAATIAYIDARLTLLADGLAYAGRDPNYAPTLERLRRAIETDRFGVVAHVLATRGCSESDCPAFRLMRDKSRVAANLKERTFDANVVLHAAAWHSDGAAPAPAEVAATTAPPLAAPPGTTGTGRPMSSKYEFPSASSIPPVSIMNAEPSTPEPKGDAAARPPAQHRAAAPAAPKERPPKEAQKEQPPKEQASKDQPPGAPTSIAPPGTPQGTLFNPR